MVTGQWGVCSIGSHSSCDVSEDGDKRRSGALPGEDCYGYRGSRLGMKKCVFPFNYNNSTRHYCTYEGAKPNAFGTLEPWCATDTDENGDVTEYGICTISCDTGE